MPKTTAPLILPMPDMDFIRALKARDERIEENGVDATDVSATTLLSDVFQRAILRCLNLRRMTVMQSWRLMVAEIDLLHNEGRIPMLVPSYDTFRRHVRSSEVFWSRARREIPSIVGNLSDTGFTSPLFNDVQPRSRTP